MSEETERMNAEVIAVYPNKVKISVDKLEDFKLVDEELKVGSYLRIADNENATLIAIIENFSIEVTDDGERKYIIEANPRASRTVPFISKAYNEPYVNYATKVMLGENKVTDFDFNPRLNGFAIKQPVFSFDKFPNVNKNLGPEMKSTGESILFIDDLKDDQFYELYSRRKMYLSK